MTVVHATSRPTVAVATPQDRTALWAAALLLIYALAVLPSLSQSLLETHAHRQTMTAYTAVLFARDGVDLMRPPLPILGPPGALPQEFPLVQAAGAGLIAAGLPPDLAMRLVGLGSFLVAAWLLYLLARRLMGGAGSLVALGAFLFNPHAWVYGRASLIEYLAVAGGLGFLYFGSRWIDGSRRGTWFGALVMGAIGVLVKITTGAFLLLPLLLWRARSGQRGYQLPGVWVLTAITMAVGLVWSAWAQAVREETPAAVFLSLENQVAWFFGTTSGRLDPGAWRVPLVALLALTGFGFVAWITLAIRQARTSTQQPFILGMLGLIGVMPLVLFNLYAIHDYYWAAVAPMLAMSVGLGAEWLRARLRSRRVRRLAVGLVGAWIATVIGMASTWTIIYGTPGEEANAMKIATFIADHSQPDDWVVLRGWGWNSAFFYYADRRGLAVPEPDPALQDRDLGHQDISEIDIERITADPIFGPFITCDREAECIVEERP